MGNATMVPDVRHYMPGGDGVYIKETVIPRGFTAVMHTHTYTHKSLLARGKVAFLEAGKTRELVAPCVITVPHGLPHSVTALEDSVWYCIHASSAVDVESVDATLVSRDKEALWRG